MSTHANMVKMTTATTGTGTITLGSASSGFQSFADAYGANATVDVLITDGTAWEVARNCLYTHSGTTLTRGTWEDSSNGTGAITLSGSAVVSVVATAGFGNRLEQQLDRGSTFIRANGSTTQTTSALSSQKVADALSSVVANPKTWWDTTNKKFLPTNAGTYLFIAGIQFGNSGSTGAQALLYKNGSTDSSGSYFTESYVFPTVTGIIELNGSTDYVELYVYTATSVTSLADAGSVFFKALYLG